MAFPGLYNEVTHVPTKPTITAPAAVLTYVLHLLMYLLLLYLRTYCTQLYLLHAHVLYLLRLCSTSYVLLYVRTALLMYVRIHIHWKKRYCCRVDGYLLHLHSVRTYILHLLMCVLHVPTDDNVRTSGKESRDLRIEKLVGTMSLLKQSQHPNEGETGRKSSLNEK